jgi:hypothetical protein
MVAFQLHSSYVNVMTEVLKLELKSGFLDQGQCDVSIFQFILSSAYGHVAQHDYSNKSS